MTQASCEPEHFYRIRQGPKPGSVACCDADQAASIDVAGEHGSYQAGAGAVWWLLRYKGLF
jgi:hypothetical protein